MVMGESNAVADTRDETPHPLLALRELTVWRSFLF